MKQLILIISLATCLIACSEDEGTEPTNQNNTTQNSNEYQCQSGDPNIVGARCKDGSRSSSTGQGACSRHGGVDHWLCQ